MTRFRLDGHVALVTGAGRGLGAAIADTLLDLGASVIGTSRSAAGAARIAERLGSQPMVLDVDDVGASADAISALVDAGVVPDLLVNNAGVNVPQRAVDVDTRSWDQVYASNVRGTFFTTQALVRHWIRLGTKGSIVMVGSQAGRVAIAERAAYGSSKAAIEQLTRSLAFEWAPHGIRVNAVAPTFVRTELTRSTLEHPEHGPGLLATIPLGRFGEAREIAGPVAFLLGEEASLITGHTLVIDGGFTIH